MGRHARGASRSRLSVAALVFVAATGAVIAVGSLYSSAAQPVPLAGSVAGSAVVVSSLSCTDSTGGTIVDVLPDGSPGGLPVRADLDACGYQEGQQLQVRYVPGDASQVVLAGNESDDDVVAGDRLLPIGLAFGVLLALGAALAVMMPAVARRLRPGRHSRPDDLPIGDGAVDGAAVQGAAAGMAAADGAELDLAGVGPAGFDPTRDIPAASEPVGFGGSWPGVVEFDAPGRVDRREQGQLAATMVMSGSAELGRNPDGPLPGIVDARSIEPLDWSPSVVDMVFPYSADLAACLHDELFTHRSRPS